MPEDKPTSFAALELDRVLALVASFAHSERGRASVAGAIPSFSAAEGAALFRLTAEVERLTQTGSLPLAGLDNAELLEHPGGDATQLVGLISLVRTLVAVRAALAAAHLGEELSRRLAALPVLDALLSYCEQRLSPAGEILDSASPALAAARAARERHRQAIVSELGELRRRHRIEAPFTVRRERYCLPVASSDRASMPGLLLDVSGSGATAFLEPFAIVERNNALAEATAVVAEEERRVLAELAATFARRRDELLAAAAILAELDAAQARVTFGRACNARLLEPGAATRLSLHGARHPLLDPGLAELRREVLGEPGNLRAVVPLTIDFDDARVILLSGPNAGGKTVVLKTVGLTALMAQLGVPVLVEDGSALPPLDGVWCHIGDEQSLLSDLSTFTAAMRATAGLLALAGENTLVLYDELGSGTDPEEGGALAAALVEELARVRCWTLATAHLVTLAAHVEQLPGAVNASMGYDELTGRPTYRFRIGAPGRSRGLDIAAGMGVAANVIGRARSLLSQAYLALDGYLARLQRERERVEEEAAGWRERQRAADGERRDLAAARERLEDERRALTGRLDEERERLRRRARERLDAALAELELAKARGEMPGRRKQATIRHTALDLGEEASAPAAAPSLAPGARVRLRGLGAVGTVSRLSGERVEVLAGAKRLWVEATALELLEGVAPASASAASVSTADDEAAAEVKLIGLTEEEAREELERFLDRALLAGRRRVRVVHGHGSGVLRRMVTQVLARHPAVATATHPPQARGGTGVTEAELE